MKKKILISLGAAVLVLGGLVFIAGRTTKNVVEERTFAAPVGKVFDLWRDPKTIQKWWGPKGYSSPVVESELREGSEFLLCMQSPAAEIFCNAGKYLEIAENSRIVTTLSFADKNGRVLSGDEIPVPGKWPEAVMVRAEFFAEGEKSRLRVTEEGVPTIMALFAGMGWQQQFDKMEAVLKETP